MRDSYDDLMNLGAAVFDDGEVVGMAQFDDGEIVGPDVGPDILGGIEILETPTSTSIEDIYHGDGGTSPLQTDYELDHQQRNESLVGPDGEPVDDVTALVQHEDILNTAAEKTSAYVNQNPASAIRAILGGQATIPAAGAAQEVVRWAGANIEARSVSIMFAPVSSAATPLPAGSTKGARPFCRVQFGTRNGLATVDVDVGFGGQFSIPANVVYVSLGQDAGSDIPFVVAASIGFFPTLRTSQITRTVYIDGAASTATIKVSRPAFSSSLWFYTTDSSGNYTLNFKNANGTVIYQQVILANAFLNDPILLANDVVTVDIVNATAIGPWNGRVVFGLAL